MYLPDLSGCQTALVCIALIFVLVLAASIAGWPAIFSYWPIILGFVLGLVGGYVLRHLEDS